MAGAADNKSRFRSGMTNKRTCIRPLSGCARSFLTTEHWQLFLREVGNPVTEEGEDEARDGEGDLLPAEVGFAARGHAGHQRGAEGEAREETADVGGVVDADPDMDDHGAEPDDQVDGGELDHARTQPLQLRPGKREPAVREQDDEDAGDAKDGSGGSGAESKEDARVANDEDIQEDVGGHA